METQERQPIPRIGDPAPDFKAVSTHGEITLSQYTKAGKWVMLFSHPADFTPVCTTEFIEFARLTPEFEKRNVQLIGLSVDSIFAHLGWEQNIEKNFGQKIPFPVIADRNMAVAALFGLIHPGASDTATIRAVFLIDPNGKVRFLIYYPLSMGRNSQELLRGQKGRSQSDRLVLFEEEDLIALPLVIESSCHRVIEENTSPALQ